MSTGDSHPAATAAQVPPATPSRVSPVGMIHHQGSDPATEAATANRFRNLSTRTSIQESGEASGATEVRRCCTPSTGGLPSRRSPLLTLTPTVPYTSFQVQYPTMKTADAQVMAALSRLPLRCTYRTETARPSSTTDRPIITGHSQPATLAAAPPASPSRDSTPAVVQVGAAPATASRAAPMLLSLSLRFFIFPRSRFGLHSFAGFSTLMDSNSL